MKKLKIAILFCFFSFSFIQSAYVTHLTFPRSGYHLLRRVLTDYFEEIKTPLKWCCTRSFGSSKRVFCGCGEIPCRNDSIVRHRHGIFDLTFSKLDKYLIQYRKDPILQFKAIKRLREKGNKIENPFYEKYQSLEEFLLKAIAGKLHILTYREIFVKKVINNHPFPENTYFLEYYNFIENPFFHVKKILKRVLLVEKVDEKALLFVIKKHNIHLRHKDTSSEYDWLKKTFEEVNVPKNALNFQ